MADENFVMPQFWTICHVLKYNIIILLLRGMDVAVASPHQMRHSDFFNNMLH